MKRSRFLQSTAGGMLLAGLAPLSSRALADDTVDYTLTAASRVFAPSPGVRIAGAAFNGTIPGPVLRVRHGQRFRARFINQTSQPATIHWHGMVLPNVMDGVENLTQPPVPPGGSFLYEYAPDPPGTRWYHDHVSDGFARGLFGLFIVEDPKDEPADAEFALVFHDVPKINTIRQAMMGVSKASMIDPMGSPEMMEMEPGDKMGDEVAYAAHCINGACYPQTQKLAVKPGQRIRLRILNANPTQTRYVRLAGHRLTVTHSDGNPLPRPIDVDALRVGVGERYDAWFTVTSPGAWLLQGISSDPLTYQQAAVVFTPGMENASPQSSPQMLDGVDYFTYEKATASGSWDEQVAGTPARSYSFQIGGGEWGSSRWTLNGQTYPHTQKIYVNRNDLVEVRFQNKTDMDHPMHLHGHVLRLVGVDGRRLAASLAKDTTLVHAQGGTIVWRFRADAPKGRWLLHCHNEIHMMDGMMTEVVYRS
ncbi:MAG TPA: multicopper oxidase family protein [Candidatus Baltobacteraceae bacterium]|jgi:FtsP/CotA-like multicopper oxidase with cupredoxin domain|nr:multicopper oxidase family protein [Candidatus Baltobacteraceae bacterium]